MTPENVYLLSRTFLLRVCSLFFVSWLGLSPIFLGINRIRELGWLGVEGFGVWGLGFGIWENPIAQE